MEREFDILVWGVTGFTGKLLLEYFLKEYSSKTPFSYRVGIAGRNKTKCLAVLQELQQQYPYANDISIVIADAENPASVDAMVQRTRVLCSLVGPYAIYGESVLRACVEHATDYCDLTGEVHFIRAMIDKYHDLAVQKQVKIVHACGFDSIPSDIGVLFAQKMYKKKYGVYASQIRMLTGKMRGQLSGGTFASMINLFEEMATDTTIRKHMIHPYALYPSGDDKRNVKYGDIPLEEREQLWMRWEKHTHRVSIPFIMAGVNTKVVRRSNRLQGDIYGSDFIYSEAMGFPRSMWFRALALNMGLGMGAVALSIPFLRRWIHKKLLFQSGEGPSVEEMNKGHFTVEFASCNPTVSTDWMFSTVSDNIDPGYRCTAKMMWESVLSLLSVREDATSPYHSVYGVLTPNSAMGEVLLERLEKQGMRFAVLS